MKSKNYKWIIALVVPLLIFTSTLLTFLGSQGSENVRVAQLLLLGIGGFALGVLYKNMLQLFKNQIN